jgi:Leucine-rich repeat (LRR) protein
VRLTIPTLEYLDVSYNNIKLFPSFPELKCLKYLNITYNDIEFLYDKEILELSNTIQVLNIANNEIKFSNGH